MKDIFSWKVRSHLPAFHPKLGNIQICIDNSRCKRCTLRKKCTILRNQVMTAIDYILCGLSISCAGIDIRYHKVQELPYNTFPFRREFLLS